MKRCQRRRAYRLKLRRLRRRAKNVLGLFSLRWLYIHYGRDKYGWYISVRPPTPSEVAKEYAKDEKQVRGMEAGRPRYSEPDFTAERYKIRDRADRRILRKEFPDYIIKIRHRRYW